jgi:hexokinase
MSNYFTTRNELSSKKAELLKALEKIHEAENTAHRHYLNELHTVMTRNPNLTAAQYAAILGKTKEERESIRLSIGMMGYMAEAYNRNEKAYRGSPVCDDPSMPDLRRKEKTITRHFIEVDEDGTPLGTFETSETKYTYSIEK